MKITGKLNYGTNNDNWVDFDNVVGMYPVYRRAAITDQYKSLHKYTKINFT